MTDNPARFPLDQGDFDLSNIFIGREQQIDLFEFYLRRWKSSLTKTTLDNDTPVLKAPSPHNRIQGLVILLYGRGGFGKSTLLGHYRRIALEENEQPQAGKVLVSELIDWETIPESRRSLFSLSTGKEIDASAYFGMLCTQLASALGKKVDDFKQYQRAAQGVKDAQQQANQLIESLRGDERFASLRSVAGTGILNLLRLVPPIGIVLNNQQIAGAVQGYAGAGIEIAAEHVILLHARLQQKLGARFSDYLEPDLKLGLSLGSDLRDFARNFPLLIFFDTYEVIDEGDNLLRIVMGAAGRRIGWVIAGRDNLWAGLEQRLRDRGIETGYKEIVLASIGKEIDFNAGGIGAFTPSDIAAYFEEIRKRTKTQAHSSLPPVTTDEVAAIWDVTKGIPLTVKLAAAIYLNTAKVTNITESVQGQRDIVDQMVRRYLLHVRDNEQDRAKLYGLALLRRPNQSAAISAALGLTPEQAKADFAYTNELSRLHRRYSFIFTEKEEPALHQEVRHFLRLWLLEHHTRPEIIAINERLQAAHEQCFQSLEQQRPYSNLKERFQDDEWVNSYLDLTEQRFWLDPVAGLRSLLPFMLAAAIYRRTANEEANSIGTFFAGTIGPPYRNWWLWARQSLVYLTSHTPSPEKLHGLEELEKLLSQQRLIFALPLSTFRNELEAAIWWRLGEAYARKGNPKALEWYEKALSRLNDEIELREAAARTWWNIALQLYKEKKPAECLSLLTKAIELKPDYANAYIMRGLTYNDLKEYEPAIVDYTAAISLDPNNAIAYTNRGVAYVNLKQYELAIADFNAAISLDPNYGIAYEIRGIAYLWVKDATKARDDFRRSHELDTTNINALWMTEWTDMGKERIDREMVTRLEQIAKIDPEAYVAYVCRGVVLGLHGKLKQGLDEIEQAIPLEPEECDAYFWKGMLRAYYYREPSHDRETMEIFRKALEMEWGLPPVLLKPLYWLERDNPAFFTRCARGLLEEFGV